MSQATINQEEMTIQEALDRLSSSQRRAYDCIERFWLRTGNFPTFDDIGEIMDYPKSSAKYFVDRLIEAGLIERTGSRPDGRPRKSGGYRLVGAHSVIDRSTLIIPSVEAFRRPGRVYARRDDSIQVRSEDT